MSAERDEFMVTIGRAAKHQSPAAAADLARLLMRAQAAAWAVREMKFNGVTAADLPRYDRAKGRADRLLVRATEAAEAAGLGITVDLGMLRVTVPAPPGTCTSSSWRNVAVP